MNGSDFVHVPALVYGTRPDTVFCSVRDGSFPMACLSDLALRWILIAAESTFAPSQGGSPISRRSSALRRKQHIYQAMGMALNQSPHAISDNLLGGMIMATVTESRIPDPAACHVHFEGYERAICIRGGLDSSLRVSSVKALRLAHLMPYIVCEPVEVEEEPGLQKQAEDLLCFLDARLPFSGLRPRNYREPGSFSTGEHLLLGEEWIPYLRPAEDRLRGYADESSHFLSLYLIAAAVSRLRDCYNTRTAPFIFVNHLTAAMTASSAVNRVTGGYELTLQGFMWVVFNCVLGLWEAPAAATGESSGNLHMLLSLSIDALRAFRRVTAKGARTEIRAVLGDRVWGLAGR
ncbi:hypothetical protein BJY01DRAFT_250458 [Aspergillus pseudoustus]|uniref:HNH nuclease domain-containing protein n=1 Tax=Aspergillus pseudoustus TaxID=1810923 RepID=A0ABR4JIW9_9EURO